VTQKIVIVDYVDSLRALPECASHITHKLMDIQEDRKLIEQAFVQLKSAAANSDPPVESRAILKINANAPVENYPEKFQYVQYRLQATLQELDKASDLLRVEREAISNLLLSQ